MLLCSLCLSSKAQSVQRAPLPPGAVPAQRALGVSQIVLAGGLKSPISLPFTNIETESSNSQV